MRHMYDRPFWERVGRVWDMCGTGQGASSAWIRIEEGSRHPMRRSYGLVVYFTV